MKLVFVRHGESEWNALNLFTGWSVWELTAKGEEGSASCRKSATIIRYSI